MTIAERIRFLGNSPTNERDIATMFNPVRLGVWFLFLNATLLCAIGGGFYFLSQSSLYFFDGDSAMAALNQLGLSEILTSIIFLSLSAFITIFVPIRVVGPIMGPRMGRYFDQIVLSGISPARYFAGKIMSQNLFLCVIAVAALPYLVICISLGGISVKFTLLGIFVLAVYTNVLALTTLLFSVFMGEIAGLLLTLIVFITANLAGWIPMVPNLFPASPSAVFLSLLYGQSETATQLLSFSSANLQQTQLVIYLLSSVAIAALCLVGLLLGPMNCLIQENGTFGEVVLKGDSKKRGFLKRRLMLRFRSEISFFYENRSPWLKRWDFVVRWGLLELLFLIALAIPFLIPDYFARNRADDADMIILAFLAGGCWLLLNNAFFLKDRATERLRHKGAEAGHIDLLFYFANLAMITAATVLLLSIARDALDERWLEIHRWGFAQGTIASQPPVWNLPGFKIGLFLFVIGFELHWFARWISLRLWSRSNALGLAIVVLFMIGVFLPLLPFLTVSAVNAESGSDSMRDLTSVIAGLSYLTGLFHSFDEYPYRDWARLGYEQFRLMLGFHFSIGLLWMLAFFRLRKKLPTRELH